MAKKGDIAVIGLAVMGQNLILNMNDKGYTVVAYNRTVSRIDEFMQGAASGRETVIPARSIEEAVSLLSRPRRIMLMVKAGAAVDDTIAPLIPLLGKGDVIIDGGNSRFPDTIRRAASCEKLGILYVGAGISGGEEGARNGPSVMPGGNPEAWPHVREILQAIAAKTDDGTPCCDWVGSNGAGHFVKMVHNGIEYGDMQIISEAYNVLKSICGLDAGSLHRVFSEWNKTELESYLIGITADIFAFADEDGSPLVEKILDSAGQKGTGKWTGISSLELGVPVTLIAEAVFARCLSSLKDERVKASRLFSHPKPETPSNVERLVEDVRKALLASKIVSYAQGFMLMREAASEYDWNLNYGSIALMWRNGCIIRSVFLDSIKKAFDKNPKIGCLLVDDYFKSVLLDSEESWRRVVAVSVTNGIPVPALSSALAFYDGYKSERLPANLIQAQRDYFGAHTYERIDKPGGRFFHTNWTGKGGSVSSGTYDV